MKPLLGVADRFAERLVLLILGLAVILMTSAPAMAGVVISAADSGPGTLRQEIKAANDDGISTLITFDPNVFPATIALASRLPAIDGEGDIIDAQGLTVVIDGEAVSDSAGERAIGLRIRAADVTVRGLTIQNFADDGIYVGPSQLASGVDLINVSILETTLTNNLDGMRISGNLGPDNLVVATIAGNTLINNRDDGITVEGSLSNSPGNNEVHVVIQNNRITGSLGVVTGGTLTGDGIRVLGGRGNGSDNQVFADILNNRTFDNVDDGIVVAGAGGNAASSNFISSRIIGNVVRNSGASESINGNGIVVRGGSRVGADPAGHDNTVLFEVVGNRSIENKDTGIVISGGLGENNYLHGVAMSNWVRGNGLDGIRVTGGPGTGNRLGHIQVEQNRLIDNQRDGVNINGGPGSSALLESIDLVANNSVRNQRFGILVAARSGFDNTIILAGITRNRGIGNTRDGLFVDAGIPGAGDTPITRNRSLLNGEDGIDIDSVGYLLTGNRAIGNTADGISAPGNTDGGGNLAFGNAGCNTPGCF